MSRRQEKARRRAAAVLDLDVRWAFRQDRFPVHAEACSMCACGRMAWLMPGAGPDEQREFDDAEADHAAYCPALSNDFDLADSA